MSINILLIEDEITLGEIIKDTLLINNFNVTFSTNGKQALEILNNYTFDVIVSDIMMPHLDGLTMLKYLRNSSNNTPVLFLSALSTTYDIVKGFETGCNDYLKKPFAMSELIVRIRALAQRGKSLSIPQKTQIGEYYLNNKKYILTTPIKKEIQLSARESDLLNILICNCDEIVETSYILKKLWGDDNFFNARSLNVYITKLRHRFENDNNITIINIRGIGYKLLYSKPL